MTGDALSSDVNEDRDWAVRLGGWDRFLSEKSMTLAFLLEGVVMFLPRKR